MADYYYSYLNQVLPEYINLHDLKQARAEDLDEVDRDSVEALAEALEEAGFDPDELSTIGRFLVNSANWLAYCEEYVEDSDYVTSLVGNPLYTFIDWERFGKSLLADYAEVVVKRGEFEGTWLLEKLEKK